MFDIQLMRSTSPTNKLDKSISTIMTISGTLKDNTSIIDPVIRIQCNLSDVKKCNYMYISAFGRYYFVNDIRSVTNNIVEFTCHVDVLTTYAAEIRSNQAITRRQENNWNLYLNDGTFRVYQNSKVVTKDFPTGFNDMRFVLALAGD